MKRLVLLFLLCAVLISPLVLFGEAKAAPDFLVTGPFVIGTAASGSTPLSYAHTRSNCWSNGRFWMFWFDGTTGSLSFSSSTDGQNWNSEQTVATTVQITNGIHYSVWCDSNSVYYSVWLRNSASTLGFRQGTVGRDGSIEWLTSEQTAMSQDTGFGYGEGQVITDSDGNPVISFEYKDTADAEADLNQARITKSDGSGTWTVSSGFPYNATTLYQPNYIWTSVVPLEQGKLYFVYYDSISAGAKGRLYDGTSWGDEETVHSYAPTGSNVKSMPSLVAVGDDVYAVYNNNANSLLFNKRTYGVGWGSESTVTTSSSRVSLSKDSENDLWAFFSFGGNRLRGVKYDHVTGQWGTVQTLIDSTSFANSDLIQSFYQPGCELGLKNCILFTWYAVITGSVREIRGGFVSSPATEDALCCNPGGIISFLAGPSFDTAVIVGAVALAVIVLGVNIRNHGWRNDE